MCGCTHGMECKKRCCCAPETGRTRTTTCTRLRSSSRTLRRGGEGASQHARACVACACTKKGAMPRGHRSARGRAPHRLGGSGSGGRAPAAPPPHAGGATDMRRLAVGAMDARRCGAAAQEPAAATATQARTHFCVSCAAEATAQQRARARRARAAAPCACACARGVRAGGRTCAPLGGRGAAAGTDVGSASAESRVEVRRAGASDAAAAAGSTGADRRREPGGGMATAARATERGGAARKTCTRLLFLCPFGKWPFRPSSARRYRPQCRLA
jgi:hypothetical protein